MVDSGAFFYKKVRFLLNIPREYGIIQTAIEMADIAENRTFSYQQIHAKNHHLARKAKLRKNTVLNLGHLDFDIVSDLELRISDFASLGIFTLVESPLQIDPFYAKQTQSCPP